MPELPEVQALVTELGDRLGGRVVERFEVVAVSALKTIEVAPDRLAGMRIGAVTRRGKFLDIGVGDLHLVLHLARAGWIRWRSGPPSRPARPGRGPLAARLLLGGDTDAVGDDVATGALPAGSGLDITEAGTKKSLAIYLVHDPASVPGIARLGPDPLGDDFTLERFRSILHDAGRSQIKGVLRDQARIAGIGNAYSDEILHVARMSPFKRADMDAATSARLYDALRETLRDAVERADGLAASELKGRKKSGMHVHGRTGLPCPVCGDTVRQVTYADSSLQYCPTCQTGGKPLADRVLSRLLK